MTLKEHFERNGAERYLTEEKEKKLVKLAGLLAEYNKKVNLTSITDEDGIYAKHIVDCAALIPFLKEGSSLLDVGCGGGFPSLPLAVLREDLRVVALDSTAKKLAFVEFAAKEIGAANIETLCGRAEELCKPPLRESFDAVTARAVASLPVLCELCLPYVRRGGIFAAMKTDGSELEASTRAARILGASLEGVHAGRLVCADGEADRCVTVFRKDGVTPPRYPRRYSQIKSGPLGNEHNRINGK